MNTTDDNTTRVSGADAILDTAVGRAEWAASAWEDAVRLQRWAPADPAHFYTLAGEVVRTLDALDDLARVLGRQVAGYAQGRAVYDDTREVDPRVRLTAAVVEL